MKKHDDDFSEEEKELFGEYFRRFMIQKNPNPQRAGCPDPGILRDLAFRRKVAPGIRRKVFSHMMKCSECVMDILDFVEEYKANH